MEYLIQYLIFAARPSIYAPGARVGLVTEVFPQKSCLYILADVVLSEVTRLTPRSVESICNALRAGKEFAFDLNDIHVACDGTTVTMTMPNLSEYEPCIISCENLATILSEWHEVAVHSLEFTLMFSLCDGQIIVESLDNYEIPLAMQEEFAQQQETLRDARTTDE